eukprot:NODE_2905_length_856_cov_319.887640.p7 GENE.NODE_2905_length_856_cov_319.887640~~NODE_2905_length_856_cov_319.887640.p7  ORF type:complete len:54 (-),score=10.28 NODE_2905_length_856_cov_319.887640:1-162(-)
MHQFAPNLFDIMPCRLHWNDDCMHEDAGKFHKTHALCTQCVRTHQALSPCTLR